MSDGSDFEAILRAVEPRLLCVKARDLAQLHRWLRDRGDRIPLELRRPLAVSRADAEESGCFPAATFDGAPSHLVLVPSPAERGIDELPAERQLTHYWRWLYALRVPTANADAVWQSLPGVLQRDAEAVLKAACAVLLDATDSELAAAFAVDLLTHFRFAPEELEYRYPGFDDADELRTHLGAGFDEADVYASTRPRGAAEPRAITGEREIARTREVIDTGAACAEAESARKRGNFARAAILFASAGRASAAEDALRAGIVARLAPILNWDAASRAAWLAALQALLPQAAEGRWCPSAKALYDLQKIAVDLEGDLFAVDPWGWAGSLGRRPMVRKLTLSRASLLHRSLLKVKRHLDHSHSADPAPTAVTTLLDDEIHRAERALREAMGPILERVLCDVGFAPATVVEEIALRKIVAELLDSTVANGHLRLGDLRDTLARNRLKMPDLAGPGEFFRGDALLQADRKLGEALDGIYYRGEVYLRWFQRGSALAFGTKVGRWFSLFVAAPFGAAFMTVEFAKYMVHEVSSVGQFFAELFDPELAPRRAGEHTHKTHDGSVSPEVIGIVLALGVVYLGLIHSTPMRSVALRLLGDLGRGIGWLFGTLPGRIWNSEPLRAVRRNRAVRWFNRRFALPLAGAAVAACVGSQFDFALEEFWWEVGGTFALLALLLNTSVGQRFQERAGDAVAWSWRTIRTNFFPGLIGWIVWFFRAILDALDRLIYTIDEWFHFRNGQSKPSLVVKVALAAVWFPVRYALRFAIYLLIEPQINPIKHFPVVTVSHKLLLPMVPSIATATGISSKWVAAIMSGVPGIFGFLAWELKENWRLYAANRPKQLKPLSLGHHGETMRGLLRPGFHSGTVPKAYASIRRALETSETSGVPAKIRKSVGVLHQVEEAIHHFAERELIAHLRSTAAWSAVPLHCSGVTLGVQHIRIAIAGTGASAELIFELVDSQIRAECRDAQFLQGSTDAQRESWKRAVLGFGAMGAVPGDDPRLTWQEWVNFWASRKS